MIYIEDIIMMDNIQTSDFPYRVVTLFPSELNKEEIFQNNLRHVLDYLIELSKEWSLLDANKKLWSCLKFDSQKEKQLQIIKESEERISEIKEKMNEGISPYYWKIMKDFDGYYDLDHRISADWLLVLDKLEFGDNS